MADKPTITLQIRGLRQTGKTTLAALIKEALIEKGIQDVKIKQHVCMHIAPETILEQVREKGYKPDVIAVVIEDLDAYSITRKQMGEMSFDEVVTAIKTSRHGHLDLTPAEVSGYLSANAARDGCRDNLIVHDVKRIDRGGLVVDFTLSEAEKVTKVPLPPVQVNNDALAQKAEAAGASIEWSTYPNDIEHIIKFTPDALQSFINQQLWAAGVR